MIAVLAIVVLSAPPSSGMVSGAACESLQRPEDRGWARWRVYGSRRQDGEIRDAERQCSEGVSRCCLAAGKALEARVSGEDRDRARSLLEKGCALGEAEACWSLGGLDDGEDVGGERGKQVERAAELFSASCATELADACLRLGLLCADVAASPCRSESLPVLLDRAVGQYAARCGAGVGSACRELGYVFDKVRVCKVPGTTESECALYGTSGLSSASAAAESHAAFGKGCAADDATSCGELALKLLTAGPGMANPEQGVSTLEKACNIGFSQGCVFLGWAYAKSERHGLGELRAAVRKDVVKAADMYRRGCKQAESWSCYELGEAYRKGIGVRTNPAEAVKLLKQACEDGVGPACQASISETRPRTKLPAN
jgi:uncharacterized protein